MDEMQLLNNLKEIYSKMAHAATKAGREPSEVRLIAVTKHVNIDVIRKAVATGLRAFGENRVQEARGKVMSDELRVIGEKIEWHLIGHLQKNKARDAVQLFDLIHSVDSIELAEELNKQAEKAGKIQRALVQVKLSDEESKQGVPESGLRHLLQQAGFMQNLRLEGLMTMPPYFEDSSMARPYFMRLRGLRDRAQEEGFLLAELSMGMSNDFEVAIEEGATMVRIGTAIFGERKLEAPEH